MFRNPYADGIIILVILLLFFGPKRLPTLGRSLGTGLREFKTSITGESTGDIDDEHFEISPAAGQPAAAPPVVQPAPQYAPPPQQYAPPPQQPQYAPPPPQQQYYAPPAPPYPPAPAAPAPAAPAPAAPTPAAPVDPAAAQAPAGTPADPAV